MRKFRKTFLLLIIAVLIQGCFRGRFAGGDGPGGSSSLRELPSTQTPFIQLDSTPPLPTPTLVPTATQLLPTPQPRVTITAINGNLYIRRGPALEYDRIGVLHNNESADVIASDVLYRWLQVKIPHSDKTGWVSIQTQYSSVDGDTKLLPNITFSDWPLPAYIKNCTEDDLFIQPGDIYLPSLYTNAIYKNEVQVNPGEYVAYDLFVAGEPVAETFSIHEDMTYYITINGEGVKHKCP